MRRATWALGVGLLLILSTPALAVGPAQARATVAPLARAQGLLGVIVLLAVALLLSENRRAISRRLILWGVALQVGLAAFLLRVPFGEAALDVGESVVAGVLASAFEGAEFVFGPALVDPQGPAGFVFAFRVLPTIIFVAALFAVLYHVGVMQLVVRAFAWVMVRLLGTSGAESLNVAASLFLGQTEAPLTIRPFLPRLTRSELMTVMVSGMALVAGGVLGAYIGAGARPRDLLTAILVNAPGCIVIAKIMIPEVNTPETLGTLHTGADMRPDRNVLEAAARGTSEGLTLALNVAAVLISFLALIALLNRGLATVGDAVGVADLSLQGLLGWAMAPVAWLIGVPWEDCRVVGGLLGTRAITNELIAYGDLGLVRDTLQPRSFSIATIALCGFANLSSIGIQIGGIGALVPERRAELAQLGLRAFLAATLANLLSAGIVGILL